MINLNPICGITLGFELEEDEEARYFFIYLFIVSISVRYMEKT
jgi:hypothetical protein